MGRAALQLGEEFAITLLFLARAIVLLRRIEPGELRQVDRARVAQAGDHLFREIVLDLLGFELTDEPA